jgi:hypothetical protein
VPIFCAHQSQVVQHFYFTQNPSEFSSCNWLLGPLDVLTMADIGQGDWVHCQISTRRVQPYIVICYAHDNKKDPAPPSPYPIINTDGKAPDLIILPTQCAMFAAIGLPNFLGLGLRSEPTDDVTGASMRDSERTSYTKSPPCIALVFH